MAAYEGTMQFLGRASCVDCLQCSEFVLKDVRSKPTECNRCGCPFHSHQPLHFLTDRPVNSPPRGAPPARTESTPPLVESGALSVDAKSPHAESVGSVAQFL